MILVCMGTIFPEEEPAFYSMITGMVDELYAYRHHFKWWTEVKVLEQSWKQEISDHEEEQDAASKAGESVAASGEREMSQQAKPAE